MASETLSELELHRAIALAWCALVNLPKERRGEALLALSSLHRTNAKEPSPELLRDLNRQCASRRRAVAAALFQPAAETTPEKHAPTTAGGAASILAPDS